MSHTTKHQDGWISIHDSSLEKDSIVTIRNREISVEIPYHVIQSIVAEQIRSSRITLLEEATDSEIILGQTKNEEPGTKNLL